MAVTLIKQNPLVPEEEELAFQSYHNRTLPTPRFQNTKLQKHTNKEENMSNHREKNSRIYSRGGPVLGITMNPIKWAVLNVFMSRGKQWPEPGVLAHSVILAPARAQEGDQLHSQRWWKEKAAAMVRQACKASLGRYKQKDQVKATWFEVPTWILQKTDLKGHFCTIPWRFQRRSCKRLTLKIHFSMPMDQPGKHCI